MVVSLWRDGMEVGCRQFSRNRRRLACQRWNLLNPEAEPKVPYLTQQLEGTVGPVIAASDYMKTYFDQLRPFIPSAFRVLGADGFGRSDTRDKLRHFFEVNRYFVVVAALSALVEQGSVKPATVATALKKYGISADKLDPSLI